MGQRALTAKVALTTLALVAAGCGGAESTGTTTTTEPVASAGVSVEVASRDIGDILVDGEGRTLYLFTVDDQGVASNCEGQCVENWPPVVGEVEAGAGAEPALLGTLARSDGTTQATYNGWPLYHFAADGAPGDTNGQGVGGSWWVISADGVPVIPTGPSALAADDQSNDGTTVTVASVTLAAPGYLVIHADGGGSPGPVIGHSELLPAGESTDVVITLDSPLTESATVFPMAHIDANGNGGYEFNPPEETIDVPATFEDGSVAVISISVEVSGSSSVGDRY